MATDLTPAVGEMTIADPSFRRSVLALRWLLLGLWIALVEMGVLDVSGVALLVSSAILAAYDIFHVVLELRSVVSDRIFTLTRHLDVVTVTASSRGSGAAGKRHAGGPGNTPWCISVRAPRGLAEAVTGTPAR